MLTPLSDGADFCGRFEFTYTDHGVAFTMSTINYYYNPQTVTATDDFSSVDLIGETVLGLTERDVVFEGC